MTREIPGTGTFIIAEAGVNHNGRPELARQLVTAAAGAGADAVKFQTWITEEIVAPGAPSAPYQQADGGSADQFSLLKRLELPRRSLESLKALAEEKDLVFLSTPDEELSADFLESLGVRAFKIGSGEVTNLPFLRHVAGKGRTVILSTGMATMTEVEAAVAAIESSFPDSETDPPLILLHAVTAYPAPPEQYNLAAMVTLRERFNCPVGLSDHTRGGEIALGAVALGARVIEKHLTLDREMEGPDHGASMNPAEFADLVRSVRLMERALGNGVKLPAPCERENIPVVRKSLAARTGIAAGDVLEEGMLTALRPGTGLSPSLRDTVIGRRAARDIAAGTILTPDMLA